jgi:pyruvate,water dikinase
MSGLEEDKTLDANEELRTLATTIRRCPPARAIFAADLNGYQDYISALSGVAKGDLFVAHFESILFRYGHRRIRRDLLSPSWADDPMIPFSVVRRLVLDEERGQGPTPEKIVARRIAVEKEIEGRLPARRRWMFRMMARYLVRYTAFRELQRFYLDLILAKVRALFLEISKRMIADGELRRVDDIFFLEVEDVLDYLKGGSIRDRMDRMLVHRLTYDDQGGTPGRYSLVE